MISTKSIKKKTYSEKEGELTMFDDVKKGEKLKKKKSIKSKTINYEQLKKNYEQLKKKQSKLQIMGN